MREGTGGVGEGEEGRRVVDEKFEACGTTTFLRIDDCLTDDD